MFRYLKNDQYYIDRYDLHTIEKCLGYYHNIRDAFNQKKNDEEFKNLSKEELESLKAKISRTNLNQSTYIRKCILEKEMTIIPGIRDLIIEIKRIGNNLNQITRLANEGSLKILGDGLSDIKEDLKKVWEQLAATLKKI